MIYRCAPAAAARALWNLVLLVGCLLVAASPVAAAGSRGRLAIIVQPGPVGPSLVAQVGKLVGRPLARQTTLVAQTDYVKAIKLAGVRSAAQLSLATARQYGGQSGAAHVLLVQGLAEKSKFGRRNQTQYLASVSLVETARGHVVLQERYLLPGKKLTAASAKKLTFAVLARLQAVHQPEPVPLPAPISAPLVMEPPPVPLAPPPRVGTEPALVAEPVPVADVVAPVPPPTAAPLVPGERPAAVRASFRAQLGWRTYFRSAVIGAKPGDDPPCYCSRDGHGPVAFSRVDLRLEFYPFAIDAPTGHHLEGLGIFVEGNGGLARTRLNDGSVQGSTVGGVAGGIAYRWVLKNSLTSPELYGRVGYASYSFPLRAPAGFPGTAYRSLTAGAQLIAPLGVPWAQLLVNVSLWPRLIPFGGVHQLLGASPNVGLGINAELGARFHFDENFFVSVLGQWDRFSAHFVGPTNLPGANTAQYTDVSLTDSNYGASILVGAQL